MPTPPSLIGRRRILAGTAALSGAALLGPTLDAAATPRRRSIALAANGTSPYVIVVGTTEGPVVQYAATDLADHLHQLTGATFPVVAPDAVPPGAKVIALGRLNPWASNDRLTASDPLPAEDPERDGFSLRSRLGDILIAGVSPRGTLYGAYWVLDRLLGIRWYAPDTTHVPDRTGQPLVLDETLFAGDHHPRFAHREFLTSDGVRQYAWRHRNLQNGRRGYETRDRGVDPVPGLDTWSTWWPGINPGQFKEIVTDQTLWNSNQLLFMKEETRTAAVTSLRAKIQARIDASGDASHPFHMNDAQYDQPDAASASFAAAHGNALSAPMLDLVNDVARQLKAWNPAARLETQAYMWALKPPTAMTVEDNVVVSTAPIFADFGAPMFGGFNADSGAQMDGWATMSDQLLMWDYHYTTMDYLLPLPDWWAHGTTVQQMATRASYDGYFGECMFTDASHGVSFKALKQWVIGRLLWDPSLDPDALIAEFCHGYYGPAGPQVLAVLRRLRAAREAVSDPFHIQRTSVGTRFLTWQVLHDCDVLMAQAVAAVPADSLYGRHVQLARIVIDHPILLRAAKLEAEATEAGVTWDVDKAARLERQKAALAASGMTQVSIYEVATPAKLADSYAIARTAGSALPPACVGLDSSKYEILDDPAIWLYPTMGTRVFDAKADDKGAARLDGSRETWGVQVSLSQVPTSGTWRLYASVRADVATGADPTRPALAYGLYPTPPSSAGQPEQVHPVSEFLDGEYHEIEVPFDLNYEAGYTYIYFTGRNPAVPYLYFDRIYFVRQD